MTLAILLLVAAFILSIGTLAVASKGTFEGKTFVVAFDIYMVTVMVLAAVTLL